MRSLFLGWRLAKRSWRGSFARTSSMALGMVLAGFVAAAFFSLPSILEGRNTRTEIVAARFDSINADGTTSDAGLTGANLQEQLPQGILKRILISSSLPSTEVALPPGVIELPTAGQVVMSPKLIQVVDADPLVAKRFPQERIGTITDEGLVGPDDLVAYVGVEPDDRLYPIAFGTTEVWHPIKQGEINIALVLAAAFLAFPAGMFLATSSRLSARARNQRLSSLRLLGMSRRAVRTVNAVETAVVAAIGAVVGCGLWALTQPALGRTGVGGFRWFAADAPLRPLTVVSVTALAALAAVAVGTVTANDAIDEPLATQRHGEQTVRVHWRGAALGLGAALLLAASRRHGDDIDNVFFVLLVVGGFASAIGTALATPVVSQVLGTWLGKRASGTTRMLVARRLRHEPSASGRILTGVLVATFALGVGQGVIGAFRDASSFGVDDATTWINTSLSGAEITSLPGVASAIPLVSIDTDAYGLPADADPQVYAATCAQLEGQLAQPLPACVDGTAFELNYFDAPPSYKLPVLVAQWPTDSSQSISGIIVPPTDVSDAVTDGWNVRLDTTLRQEFAAALVAGDPYAFTGIYPDDRELGDMVSALVTAGAIAAFVIGLGAVVVATADRAVERRTLDANLLALGIPGNILRRAQLWTVSLPVAVTVTLAALIGTLAGHLFRQAGFDEGLPYPWSAALISSSVGLAGAALAGGLAYVLARTNLRPGDLRRE